MATGKNTSRAAIDIFESGFRTPNQLLRMGATAMMGMVLAPMARGSRTSRAMAQRAVRKPTSSPAVVPRASPPMASMMVAMAGVDSRSHASQVAALASDG